jgi:uncharacterized protein YbjT (DUF2867 family)
MPTIIGAPTAATVVHIVGIVEESPPERRSSASTSAAPATSSTEAERAGVGRSSSSRRSAPSAASSDYHRSKLEAERIVAAFAGAWTILRTGAVVGPGDETVSVLLRMVRTLPAVPVIDGGDQPFQPVWHEDLAWAIAECLERDDVAGARSEHRRRRSAHGQRLLDLFASVTDRSPLRVPLPSLLARLGTSIASAVGIETPVSAATVQMLLEGNVIRDGEDERPDRPARLPAEPIRTRLVQLVDDMPEQTPDEGVGRLQRRRFRIDIRTPLRAASSARSSASTSTDIVPFEAAAEPGARHALDDGATLTLELPARGHVQVRVEQIDDALHHARHARGAPPRRHRPLHVRRGRRRRRPLHHRRRRTAGVPARPDLHGRSVGSAAQKRTWIATAENVCEHAGGRADWRRGGVLVARRRGGRAARGVGPRARAGREREENRRTGTETGRRPRVGASGPEMAQEESHNVELRR